MNKIITIMLLILTIFASVGCIEEVFTSENRVKPGITSLTDFSSSKPDTVFIDGEPYDVIYDGKSTTFICNNKYELVESTKVGVTDNDVEISKIKDVENNNTIYVASRGDSISISVVVFTDGYSQVQTSCGISSVQDLFFDYSVDVDQNEYEHGDWVTVTYSTNEPAVIKVFDNVNADIWHYLDVPEAIVNETWMYYIGDTDPYGDFSVLFGNDDFLVSDYYSVVKNT